VFCGGAALYFMWPAPAPTEVVNDINGELINLYRVVQNHLEEFVRQFKWAISSRQIFKWHQFVAKLYFTRANICNIADESLVWERNLGFQR
jgi:site-specific DNA-adenine methylase